MNRPLTFIVRSLRIAAVSTLLVEAVAQETVVKVDGSSTVYPIMQAAAKAFEGQTNDGAKVDVQFSGTTGGFRKFVTGETDIQDASRPILESEIAEAKANGIEYIEIPVAFDALTVAVNAENDWLTSIKTSELKKIWEPSAEGQITRWSQIRPEWPNEEIKLYGAGKDSGTYDYFAEVITGGKTLRNDFVASEDDNELVQGISASKYAMGFIPFSYFSAEGTNLKAVAVENDLDAMTGEARKGKAVSPSNKAVRDGVYIPLGRPLFIYVNARSFKEKPAVAEFVHYFLENADAPIKQANYLPLSEVAYLQALRHLDENEVGTRFNGKPVTGIAFHDLMALDPQ